MPRLASIAVLCAALASCVPAPPEECRPTNAKALGRRQASITLIIRDDGAVGVAIRRLKWQFAVPLSCGEG